MVKFRTPLVQAVSGIGVELAYIAAIILAGYVLCVTWQFLP